ncbi:DNA repair protein RecO [Vagococcus vulneris]|uniref:DNA repair protein RecO n=1 Tax=Vagococcus vulneris TaxID=1977869 RepID=A0A430A224_9ENTE|nr:DNA repair protein RecO [Vagococcus vulneris]RSU00488.1 DNA repair protein RecO [Vagococcus vulneris]
MGRQIESKAIVLFAKDYREKDKLVKLFTETHGKRMFFVRRAHQKNNPLTAAIQPFTEAEFIMDLKDEGLSFLNGVKEVTPYRTIQSDIFISAYATYILNLVDAAVDDNQNDAALYGFAKQSLDLLNNGYDPEVISFIFEIQLLQRFGIQINWNCCAVCGETQGPFDYSDSYHGLLCEKDWSRDERRSHFDSRSVYFMQLFSSIRYSQINNINLSDEIKQKIRQNIDTLYEDYVGIHLKSKRFIDQMKNWENTMKLPEKNKRLTNHR